MTVLVQRKQRDSEVASLYVVEFSTHVVKVGRSANPTARIEAHRRAAAKFGVSITQTWVSEPHPDSTPREAALIAFARLRYPQSGGDEYFEAADFDAVVEFAQQPFDGAPNTSTLPFLTAWNVSFPAGDNASSARYRVGEIEQLSGIRADLVGRFMDTRRVSFFMLGGDRFMTQDQVRELVRRFFRHSRLAYAANVLAAA